ncbi:MAG: MtrB/PioB family outer membrane beta-barrel protein [Burkholderiales bacterium]
MKFTKQYLLVASLFVAPTALAQMAVTGSVTPGYLSTDFNGTNRFRFDEYRDMRSGGTLGAEIKGEGPRYYLNFFGENIGRDDQFLELKGGQYGLFKYSLTNNNIIRNLTSNAATPFGGVNSNNLTFNVTPGLSNSNPVTNPILNTANWGRFDYSVKHENYGGTFEWQSISSSPFYFRATGNQKETKGVKPFGQAVSSPGGQAVELPQVVDYTTTDASAELGYSTKLSQYALNVSWSKFKDNNDFFTWRNPLLTAGTTTERTTIAADNSLWKVGLNAMWKQLPMSSTLALRGSYSETSNGLPIAATGLAVATTTGQVVNMNANNANFDGKIANTTLAASLTSVLAKGLDSRVYLNYYDRKNKSTEIVMTPRNAVTAVSTQSCDLNPTTGAALTTCTNERFHMTKDNFGLDLQYRANSDNKFSGGWDYTKIERERRDFEKTRDNKFYVEWKNNSLETVTGKIKLQYMDRDADFLLGGLNGTLSATNFYNKEFKRFDLAGNKQTLARFGLDSTPIPFLDLGAELIFKNNDYKDINLGRKNDERKEFYFTAGYGDARVFRVSVFADYEQTEYVSEHFVGTPPATYPAGQSTAAYQWSARVKDKNYVFGVAADWPYSERLRFKGSYIWQQTNGSVDQTAFPGVVFTNITAYDTFRRNTLDLRGIWTVQKNLDLNFGYAYENYKYTDAQMDNYSLTPTNFAGTSNLAVLSGAYANPTYRANIFYASLKYMFK